MKNFTYLIGILFLMIGNNFHFNTCIASKKYNRYLAHIFNKYGTGGTMTFEGLEHLMFNLGLGRLEFNPTHTIDEHHPNGYKIPDFLTQNDESFQSLIEEQTINLLSDNDVQISRETFLQQKQSSTEERKSSEASNISNFENTSSDNNDNIKIEFKENLNFTSFKEMHDPKHRHPRHHDESNENTQLSSNICLTPKSVLRLVIDHEDLHKRKLSKYLNTQINDDNHNSEEEYNQFVNNVKLTPVAFMKLCPALLAQIDQHVCVKPAPIMYSTNKQEFIIQAWIYSTASIFILSSCGLLGILLIPLMKTLAYQEILKFLVAIAVGTLSGDALMHLLPHALSNNDDHNENIQLIEMNEIESHNHSDTVWICACAFFTAVFMYILETLLPLLKGENHSHSHGHHHDHSHNQQASLSMNNVNVSNLNAKELNVMLNETQKDEKTGSKPLTPVAFMVIIGDSLHNLTDGLAIGAAFASDPITGMATAFAVLCHELPHELGDFALLLQTGISIRKAICLNIISSILSFVGMALGLLVAGLHKNMIRWIYSSTAGSFLYIAFSDLIPAMSMENSKTIKNTLIRISGILVGGIIMILIALNEDHLRVIFQ